MAWVDIPNTNWQYDDAAYSQLPQPRKDFWDKQTDASISNGIVTKNGYEYYLRVKLKDESNPNWTESMLNKTYLDNL